MISKHILKKNDTVEVLSGKDKGRVGKILSVFPKSSKAVVERINIVKRHTKPSATNQQGGIIEVESPVDLSNLQIICKKCSKTVKVNFLFVEGENKVRICKKCNEHID